MRGATRAGSDWAPFRDALTRSPHKGDLEATLVFVEAAAWQNSSNERKMRSLSLSSDVPKSFRIYALVDTRSGQMRYVGQTANTLHLRLQDHLRRRSDRSRKAQWIQEVLAEDFSPQIVLLEEFIGRRKHAYERESAWFRRLRAEGHDLTN